MFGGLGDFELPPLLIAARWIEVIGGPLMLIGLGTRWVAFILSGEMAVAYFVRHAPMNLWPLLNGGEITVMFCFVWLYFAARGPGKLSLDAALKLE
jgi:putative oxidoreductase